MNILVPVDFSASTPRLTDQVKKMAQAFSGKTYLLHVVAPDPDFVGYEAGPQHVRDHLAEKFHEEHRQIQALAQSLKDSGLPSVTPLLIQGPTVEIILEEAKRLSADMLIMGSHGHGALYHVLLGSVSEGVLKKAPCPVLFVPAGKDNSDT